MTALQTTTITAALIFGMCLALLGSLKLALAKRLNLGEGRIGVLLSALNSSIIPLMLLAGLLIDALGAKAIVILGSLTTALAVASVGLRPSYGRAFGSLLLAGLGSAGLGTAALVLMPRAFFGMDQMASASLNLGCVFIALGALVAPVLSDVLVRLLEFRRTASVLAALCLAPALAAALTPTEQLHVGVQSPDLFVLLSDGNLWLVGLVFFFYAPLEGSVSVWATTQLTDLGQGERGAVWILSAFWGAFLASRLLTAMLFHWAAAPRLGTVAYYRCQPHGGGGNRQHDRHGQPCFGAIFLSAARVFAGADFPDACWLGFPDGAQRRALPMEKFSRWVRRAHWLWRR